MGRGAVEVEIIFFDVLPVVALAIGQAEQPFLEDRVLAIPQRKGKTQALLVVAETRKAVLSPMVSSRACLVVGEIVPGITVFAVVLADRAPLALAEVWTPLLPRHSVLAHLVETRLLGGFHTLQPSLVRQFSSCS